MRLRRPSLLSLPLLPLTLAAALPAVAQSPQLTAVFNQMDAASKRFQSATADVERDNYEKVVRETTVEKGTLFIDRARAGMDFGATVYDLGPDGKPQPAPARILNYSAGVLRMYTPGTKQIDVFKASNNQSRLEGYFSLGFGGTSHDLQAGWTITDGGPETLSDGTQQVKTEKLVLVSKDPGVQSTFKTITIWLDPARDVSLKQVFETPAGDRQTAIYTNIRLNAPINHKPYTLPTKGVTVVPH